jgi:hypothetical protein
VALGRWPHVSLAEAALRVLCAWRAKSLDPEDLDDALAVLARVLRDTGLLASPGGDEYLFLFRQSCAWGLFCVARKKAMPSFNVWMNRAHSTLSADGHLRSFLLDKHKGATVPCDYSGCT